MPGLTSVIRSVFDPVFDELQPGTTSNLRPSLHADFQVDGALAVARALGRPPREVAEEVLGRARAMGLGDLCERAEIAGPGFINLTLSAELLARQLREMARDVDSLGIVPAEQPLKVVVDYAGPNAAKQMHVGHLRSTIIGDAVVRLLEVVGHSVVRENHVGDWGAPFGMLIERLTELGDVAAERELATGDLDAFYQGARAAYDTDPAFAERARARVVLLQSGDPATLRLWRLLVERSLVHFNDVFRRLGTKLTRDDVVGESYYNPMLPGLVAELARAGILVESDGAQCVFLPGQTNREGDPLPLIVQNSVGGYTYAATDLAAIKDRTGRLGAQLLVYVVGRPQAQHFEMVFAAARLAGWLPEDARAVHVGFGNVLGPDGKMFRTRQGGTVKLVQLLDEAVDRARALVLARSEEEGQPIDRDLEAIAHAVGTGAVKYSDLCTDRVRDYRFDWDRMLSLDGNTAPYMQYAHARTRSILRRSGLAGGPRAAVDAALVAQPEAPEERELAKLLLGFGDAVAASLESYSPHKLCAYLFALAGAFTSFYEHCPVLRASTPETRSSRLVLCALTSCVLEKGLGLLGIEAPERM